MLWYTVHSVVYTCDLILARIWLLGLCPFINRVLQSGIRAVSTIGWSLDRTGRVLGLLLSNPCLLKLFYYYTPWILWLLPFLPWLFSLKNSFCRFWPESDIWPPWVLARWPFHNNTIARSATRCVSRVVCWTRLSREIVCLLLCCMLDLDFWMIV